MSTDEPGKCENEDLQSIPKEWQEISTEEIVEADYDVVPTTFGDDEDDEGRRMTGYYGRLEPPGRTPYDDSIDASSEDTGGTEHGYLFSAGYESSMATRIGDEEISDPKADRLRELHEGRHRSDGEHSVRESDRDKERIPQAVCSTLPLASHERHKVIGVVQDVDYTSLGNQKALIKVTLGVVAVVIDEREREVETYDDLISRSDEYRSICESHEISMSDLSTVKSKIREALDEGEVSVPQGEKKLRRDPALPDPTPANKLPDIYWEEKAAEYWVWTAQRWERTPDEFKEAVPEKYQKRVKQLRKWEPWKNGEVSEPTSEEKSSTSSGSEDTTTTVEIDEDAVLEEAKQLVREMDEESTE